MSNQSPVILIVDDEPAIRRVLTASLVSHGYSVQEAATGQEALALAASVRPDLIVLDLGLPDLDGTEVTRRLREWTQTPILILSVRDQEEEKVAALDAGADDYLTKPFGPSELQARIRAALRRALRPETGPVLTVGELTIDMANRQVRSAQLDVQLTPTEYDLLKALAMHPGKVLTHQQLLSRVWGGSFYEDGLHLLRVNISNLRRKLEPDPARPRYVVTEPGVGYRLQIEG